MAFISRGVVAADAVLFGLSTGPITTLGSCSQELRVQHLRLWFRVQVRGSKFVGFGVFEFAAKRREAEQRGKTLEEAELGVRVARDRLH